MAPTAPAVMNPQQMIDSIGIVGTKSFSFVIPEKEIIDKCKDVHRDLSREQVYSYFLQRCFDIKGIVHSSIDGGWMNYPRGPKSKEARDWRVMILTSDHRSSWNVYHTFANVRDHRKMPLDERMLPYRTEEYLKASTLHDQERFEKVATDNRILYEQYLLRGNRGTRTPLLVPLLDHYHFIFFYYGLAEKNDQINKPKDLMRRPAAYYYYNQEVAEGKLTYKAILGGVRGCYFELLQIYTQTYFPRDLGVSSNRLDVERALRMTGDAEKFLRIMIEMWLERNSVANPDLSTSASSEPTDMENKLANSYYESPTKDSLLGLSVVLTYLLARKAEVDVASQQSRTARIVQFCPALQILHQPMFIYLVLAFRNLAVTSKWTEFCLAVNLWLIWIDPSKALVQVYGDAAKDKKAREALGSEHASNQHLILLLVQRVLRVFLDEDLNSLLRRTCEGAQQLWEAQNNLRGRDLLIHHLRQCRLSRCRPCLMVDVCQDANNLAAEIQPHRFKAEEKVKMAKAKFGHVKLLALYVKDWIACQISGTDDHEQQGSSIYIDPAEMLKTFDMVVDALCIVFPQVRQKLLVSQPGRDASVQKDADRDSTSGLLLTKEGRMQILSGMRGCDPTKIKYLGDPVFNPEIGEFEIPWLVRWSQILSIKLSRMRDPEYDESDEAFEAIYQETKHEGGHIDVRRKAQTKLTPINCRWIADIRYWRGLFFSMVLLCLLLMIIRSLEAIGDVLPVL